MITVLMVSLPGPFDFAVIAVYTSGTLALILAGYYFLVADFRSYLRALRGMMIRVVHEFPSLPNWARYHTPYCLRALGLKMPCSTVDVKRAYLRLAEQHHPDRGGDPRKFHALRQHYEMAMRFVEHVGESGATET